MRYLMLIHREQRTATAATDPAGGDVDEWVTRMDGRGVRVTGDPVAPDSQTTTVRVVDGGREVTPGPARSGEDSLIGFDLLDCRDLDEAIAVAADHPLAWRFAMELRPIVSD